MRLKMIIRLFAQQMTPKSGRARCLSKRWLAFRLAIDVVRMPSSFRKFPPSLLQKRENSPPESPNERQRVSAILHFEAVATERGSYRRPFIGRLNGYQISSAIFQLTCSFLFVSLFSSSTSPQVILVHSLSVKCNNFIKRRKSQRRDPKQWQ